jgi:predicted nucleic acid-binding Zn ribbon protein
MEESYKKLIESWPKRWRTRIIVDYPEIVNFLNAKYAGVSLNIQISSFLSDTSPYCIICNQPVKLFGKATCSIKCREINAKKYSQLKVEKHKKTLIDRYGVDNIRNIPGIIDKSKDTMLQKYGSLVSDKAREKIKSRVENLNTKGRKTLKEKYGVDNPGQLPTHREKSKETLLKNYGVDNYFLSDEFKAFKENRRFEKYNNFCPASIEILNIESNEEKEKIFNNPNKIIIFKCTECNTDDHLPSETLKWRIRTTGTCCSKCGGISKSGSLKENQIANFIEQELLLDIKKNARILDGGLEIDIYIPSLQLGIEFDGLFWHNDLRIDKKYHINKTKLAAKQGIKLIHIFEDEWDHKQDIVKSRLRVLTNKIENVIYARNCVIKEINSKEEKSFLNENHIQGWSRSSIKLGLFYNNQLISVMTFSAPNKSKGQRKENNFWELLRFCSIKNTIVVGSANKLFSYFIKNYDPHKILSFADSRWSVGNLYNVLKFSKENDTPINYWYIDTKNTKRLHRFSLRKNINDDQSITEYENRLNQGYLRIWDCGNSKWIWKKGS